MEGIRTLLKTDSRRDTVALGKRLGHLLRPGDVVALVGDLGSGKTTFAKGLAVGLGVESENAVKSPTYVLMHIYQGNCPVYHLDLFRLDSTPEVENIGWDDLLTGEGVVLIEWAKKIDGYLPSHYLEIEIKSLGETVREFCFRPRGERFKALIKELAGEK